MKKLLLISTLVCLSFLAATESKAQTNEFGFTIGACNFYGDLGGANKIGRPIWWDFEFSMTRPAVGLLFRRNYSGYVSSRFNLYYAYVGGDDNLITKPGDPEQTDQWWRYTRNFSFRSPIIELSAQIEINFMRYEIGRKRYRFAPYGFLGFGGFYFNPKAKDKEGNWVKLKPLHTEGQGMPNYPDRKNYSLIQPNMLLGLGFKYNISENWSVGFEYGHRITWTDYIDDVSKSYVAQSDFDNFFAGSPNDALKAYEMSRRSMEIPETDPNYIPGLQATEVGDQRGDPSDNDHYVFIGVVTLTYTVTKGKIYCPKF